MLDLEIINAKKREDLCFTIDEEWQNKLWYDDQEDEYTIAVKRNRDLWNRNTIAELKTLIAKLEEE